MGSLESSRVLEGEPSLFKESRAEFEAIPIDQDLLKTSQETINERPKQTIARPGSVSGSGTFSGKNTTTIRFEPTTMDGWWFDRSDIPNALPFRVSARNVWTTGAVVSNIVLRSGPPHNYVRMVEHLISLEAGLDIDNLMIRIDSGDPPLFENGSLDLVEALENCGRQELGGPTQYYTVKEPATCLGPRGEFISISPPRSKTPELNIDTAISFKSAIGTQRIRFPVTRRWVRYGSLARTNTSFAKMIYCKTVGNIFANIRNLGYTRKNILIAGRNRYINEPRLIHNGKALEAIWHRGVLDLLAAVALVEEGQLVGDISSYKAGHRLDANLIIQLYLHDLLTPFQPKNSADEAVQA